MSPGTWIPGVLALSLAIAGCAGLRGGVDATAVRTFMLDADTGVSAPAPREGPVVVVAAPLVATGYDGTGIVYSRDAAVLERYGYSEWVGAPGGMLWSALLRALESSGTFSAVLRPSTPARADLRLDPELIELRHAYRDGTGEGRIRLRATLVAVGTGAVVFTRTYAASAPAAASGPAAGVAAINAALTQVLVELTADLRAAATTRP
ncbi:MAG: membrane integrity-associated transporter subunit PqiC [Gammaproteobacteria bacterium]|nr:membrane integrity-associated transporter subunit PqiC [Gammaproteobacteria bacterium]